MQKTLSSRLSRITGLFVTSAVYALIHIFAFNFMLFVAAAVCGLFWGFLYLCEGSLVPVIVSHALWDLMRFVLFPFNRLLPIRFQLPYLPGIHEVSVRIALGPALL